MNRRTLLGATAVGVAMAAGCTPNSGNGGSAQLNDILNRLSTDILKEAPEFASTLGVSEEQAGGRYIDRLTDVTRVAARRRLETARTYLTELQGLSRDTLQGTDPVTYDVAIASLESSIDTGRFEFGGGSQSPYVVTQLIGAYTQIPDFLDSRHAVTNRDEADAYLARLSAYATMLDQESAMIAEDAGNGMIPPDFCVRGGIAQLTAFANLQPANTVLVQSLARRVGEVEAIAAADKTALTTQAETIVRDQVLPAYRRQIEALQAIQSRATHDAGIWSRPQGEEIYASGLKAYTTTNMTADEVHNMGVELVNSINAEMDTILKAEGMTRGTVAERMAALQRRPDQLYPNTDAGRTQLLADLNTQVQEIQARMSEVCGTLARTPLEIVRVPEYIQAGAPGGYYQNGSLDGTRPGQYYINLRDTSEWPKFSLPTLSYHEGVPGHHWQISIQQEAQGLPFFRTALSFFGAFAEGWGLYAEQLADEMGVYTNNQINKLGYLQSAAFRASRLVVDTGMHAKRWTREQAIQSMMQATGNDETSTVTEIERYAVWPGQACSYMVGKQAILRMRESARTTLGANFDIKGFHDTLLTNGATPLTVSEQLVQTWAAGVSGPAQNG
jgi:uncharacterized protein (DUF885 family)